MINIQLYKTPTHEIDRTIEWLEGIKMDCEYRIYELKNLKASRTRAQKYRDNLNALALQIYTEGSDFLEIDDHDTRIQIIQQRLGCERNRAEAIHDILQGWAKRERKEDRDKQIVLLAKSGMKKAAIAEKCGISRQQVYNVIRQHEKSMLLKHKH